MSRTGRGVPIHTFELSFATDRVIDVEDLKDKLRQVLNRQTFGIVPMSMQLKTVVHSDE